MPRRTSNEELQNSFAHHPPPNEDVVTAHEEVRAVFTEAAVNLNAIVPEGRYKSLLWTALETAGMWANKAVALQPEGVFPRATRSAEEDGDAPTT